MDLLVICSSKMNNVLTSRSFNFSSSSLCHICGFYITHSSFSTFVLKSFA
jgi:hypothetical protein